MLKNPVAIVRSAERLQSAGPRSAAEDSTHRISRAVDFPLCGWAKLAARLCQAPIGFLAAVRTVPWLVDGADLTAAGAHLNAEQRDAAKTVIRHVVDCGHTVVVDDETRPIRVLKSLSPTIARSVAATPVFRDHALAPAAVIGVLDPDGRIWPPEALLGLQTLAAAVATGWPPVAKARISEDPESNL